MYTLYMIWCMLSTLQCYISTPLPPRFILLITSSACNSYTCPPRSAFINETDDDVVDDVIDYDVFVDCDDDGSVDDDDDDVEYMKMDDR